MYRNYNKNMNQTNFDNTYLTKFYLNEKLKQMSESRRRTTKEEEKGRDHRRFDD